MSVFLNRTVADIDFCFKPVWYSSSESKSGKTIKKTTAQVVETSTTDLDLMASLLQN